MRFLPDMTRTPTRKLVRELQIYTLAMFACFTSVAAPSYSGTLTWCRTTGVDLVFALLASVFALCLVRGVNELGVRLSENSTEGRDSNIPLHGTRGDARP